MIIFFQLCIVFILTLVVVYMALTSYMVYRGCNYIPTPPKEIEHALSVLKPGDTFIDLGFGYGEVLEAALRKGAAKVIGYELDPLRFLQVWWKLRRYNDKVELHFADIWSADLSQVDVIFTFFTVIHMKKLYDKVRKEAELASWFMSYVHEVPGVQPTKQLGKVRFFKLELR